ncbi:Type 1 glutamine amidotransferase-like domain-containing protein [Sorangium cellulosum]|nr:Type 1 glutamine amidotransferase-like domain-containing protein [Sorangium cellulosum]
MRGTALIYSSHSRCNVLHNDHIVQRALRGQDNKRILFLPMSSPPRGEDELEGQRVAYEDFRWFFQHYERFGLEHLPFYWTSGLRKQDVDVLWHHLWSSEVVILGGGYSTTGLWRYKELGARFDGEPGKFGRLLHERRQRGLLTVGFSAGADQLCQFLFCHARDSPGDNEGFGLARNTLVTLHHEASRNDELWNAARQFPHCFVFGLPNDSGLNVDWGVLPSGNLWQVYEVVIDRTWDAPGDALHIKTRQGALVDHIDHTGRHWAFQGGDHVVRITSPDNRYDRAWMTAGGKILDYWTRESTGYGSLGDVLAGH